MNKYITIMAFAILLVSATTFTKAQDVITLKNGTQLRGTVMDVTPTQIKYTKDGSDSSLTIAKTDILVVDYKDGSTLMFNNVTPKDNARVYKNFFQRLYITIGSGVNFGQRSSGGGDDHFYYPLSTYIPANFSIGATINKRFGVDIQLDYNRTNYIYTGPAYVPGNTDYSYVSGNGYTNALTLIPNFIISANQHKFTPYGRIGVLVTVLDNFGQSQHVVNYQNQIITSTENGSTNRTITQLADAGTFISFGCNWTLNNRFAIYGEGYYKGPLFGNSFILVINNGGGGNTFSGGINLGLKIAL